MDHKDIINDIRRKTQLLARLKTNIGARKLANRQTYDELQAHNALLENAIAWLHNSLETAARKKQICY